MLQLENKLLSIDKPTALPSLLTITATLDFDLSPWLSIPGKLLSLVSHAHAKYNVQRSIGSKLEWKQTGGQTDTTDRITFFAYAVGKVK